MSFQVKKIQFLCELLTALRLTSIENGGGGRYSWVSLDVINFGGVNSKSGHSRQIKPNAHGMQGRKCGGCGRVVHPQTYVSVGLQMSAVGLQMSAVGLEI